jgi:hypothetical protein
VFCDRLPCLEAMPLPDGNKGQGRSRQVRVLQKLRPPSLHKRRWFFGCN